MSTKNPKYIAFDLETGGLDPNKNAILTANFTVLSSEFTILDSLDLKLKPQAPFDLVEQDALKVSGINLSTHILDPEACSYEEGKRRIIEFIKKHKILSARGKNALLRPLGQNIIFDIGFLKAQLFTHSEWESLFHYSIMDTKIVADFLKDCGLLPKEIGRLESLVEFFQVHSLKAHDAKNDVKMCIDVYAKMVQMISSKNDNSTSVDLLDIIEA